MEAAKVDNAGNTKLLNRGAVALVVGAFVLPFVSAGAFSSGTFDAFAAGQSVPQTLAGLAAGMFVSWLITRKRGEHAKAAGRFTVALLMVISAASGLTKAGADKERARDFLQATLAHKAKQEASFRALSARFDAAPYNQLVVKDAIAAPGGLTAAQKAIADFLGLLDERQALFENNLAETEVHFKTAPISEGARTSALETFRKNAELTAKAMTDLGAAQRETALAIKALLHWAVAENIQVRDGQLQFTSTAQRARALGLIADLSAAEERQAKAEQLANQVFEAAEELSRKSAEGAEKFLK